MQSTRGLDSALYSALSCHLLNGVQSLLLDPNLVLSYSLQTPVGHIVARLVHA